MAKRFTVEAVFKGIDRITAPITRMQSRVGKFSRGFRSGLTSINRGVDKMIGGLRKVAAVAIIAFASISFAMADVIRTGAEFELNIIRAATKFPEKIKKGTEAFKGLSKEVRDLAATTEFTAAQTSKALDTLATAGFSAESAIKSLPKVMGLATVAQIELADASRIGIKTMGAFGLKTKDPIQKAKNLVTVTDLLAKASTSATTTIEDLFEAISNGAGTATAANIDMVDTVTLLNLLADNSIDASKAGNMLKRFALSLTTLKEGSDGARALKELNIQTTEFIKGVKNTRNVFSILKDLKKAVDALDPADRLTATEAIFGKRTITAALGLMRDAGKASDEMRKKVEDNTGAVKRMSESIREATEIRLRVFKSRVDELKLKIFDFVEGPLNKVIKAMTKWLELHDKDIARNIGEFFDKVVRNWDTIVQWAKAIGWATLAVIGLIVVLKIFVLVMTAVNIAIAMNPIGLIIIAVLVFTAIVTVAAIAIIFFRKEILGWWDDLDAGGKKMAILVGGPLLLLIIAGSKLVEAWKPVGAFFSSLFEDISSLFEKLKELAGLLATGQIVKAFEALDKLGLLSPQGQIKKGGEIAGKARDKALGVMISQADPMGALSDMLRRALSGNGENAETSELDKGIKSIIMSQMERVETINKSEVTIKDETGRAEVTNGKLGNVLTLEPTGSF